MRTCLAEHFQMTEAKHELVQSWKNSAFQGNHASYPPCAVIRGLIAAKQTLCKAGAFPHEKTTSPCPTRRSKASSVALEPSILRVVGDGDRKLAVATAASEGAVNWWTINVS